MDPGEEVIGLHAWCFAPGVLDVAVERLVAAQDLDVGSLKFRSGEHLAAIVLTAVLGQAPCRLGTSGDVDLEFDDIEASGLGVPAGRQAVEVKSIGDSFRKFDAFADRHVDPGGTHYVRVGTVDALMTELQTTVEKAAAKTMTVKADGRHVFVVVHPLERLCVEHLDTFVGAVLPSPDLPQGVDALWVMWYPDQLAVWSVAQQRWTQLMWDFVFEGDDREADEDQTAFERAEASFMAAVHPGTPSPFQFKISMEPEDASQGTEVSPHGLP